MDLKDIIAQLEPVANAVDRATPPDVKPVVHAENSRTAKWAIVSLIGAMVGVYAMLWYIVVQTFGKSQWPHTPAIVTLQLENQKAFAYGQQTIFGIVVLAVIYGAVQLKFAGQLGVIRFGMDGGPPPDAQTPVATVTVSAPATSQVEVATPAGAEDMAEQPVDDMPMEAPKGQGEAPPPPSGAYPQNWYDPTRYGD